jgi:zinc protease
MRYRNPRVTEILLGLVCAALVVAAAPGVLVAQGRPAGKPATAAAEGKKGTSVVPAGVKLVAQMPGGGAPRPYPFPKAATRTLANGLRVFVVSDSEQPAVTVRLVLPLAGSIHNPAGKPGVAEMTANLITQGTAKRTAQQIAEAIDFVGGTLSATADSDGSYVTVTVVKKDLGTGLDLLADVTRSASFRDEELERRRQQALSGLRVQYADPDYLATVIFRRRVYGDHPYGLPDEGTPESIRALQRDDLVKFRDAWYVPDGALLAFAGDITPEAAFAAAEKYFGDWAKKETPATSPPPPAPAKGVRVLLVDKPDAVQTQIRVGRLGIPRASTDYIPVLVANRIFGGGFNSRLSTEVRIRKGLTYGASSAFDSRLRAGSFVAATSTRTEATVEAAKLIVSLLEQMATGAVTAEELNFARDYLAGVYPIQTETPEQVAGRILTAVQYGLPADYNETYQQRILAVGPEQVKAVASKYFAAGDAEVVLVGNVGAFRDALKKEFPGAQFEEMSFDQVDLLAAGLRKPKEAAASPEALGQGRAMANAAAEAAGMKAARLESVETAGAAQISTPRGPIAADVKVLVLLPAAPAAADRGARILTQIHVPAMGGAMLQGYDGQVAWISMGPQSMELPPQMAKQSERDALLVGGLGLYQLVLAGRAEIALAGEEDVQGTRLVAADWNGPAGRVKLYFDAAQRLLVGARYQEVTPQGSHETLELWSDFRDVQGVKFPFRSTSFRDGTKYREQTLTEVKLNVPVDPAAFLRPRAQ